MRGLKQTTGSYIVYNTFTSSTKINQLNAKNENARLPDFQKTKIVNIPATSYVKKMVMDFGNNIKKQ